MGKLERKVKALEAIVIADRALLKKQTQPLFHSIYQSIEFFYTASLLASGFSFGYLLAGGRASFKKITKSGFSLFTKTLPFFT